MEKLNKFQKIRNRIYYNLFIEKFNKKINYNFPDNYFRWDLIAYLIKKYNYTNYLEIGCDRDQLFSKVKIQNKIGVDPFSGGTVRKTSDKFFLENNEKFDIVFIDGLHIYSQVKKDILSQEVNTFYRTNAQTTNEYLYRYSRELGFCCYNYLTPALTTTL